MFNLKNLSEVSQKLKKDGIRNDNYSSLMHDVFKYISDFQHNKNPELLKKAAIKLLESLKIKSHNAEAYLLLSYIFYITGEDRLCLQNLKIAKSFAPNSSLVMEFQEIVSQNINKPKKIKVYKKDLTEKTTDKKKVKIIRKLRPLTVNEIKKE